MKKTIPICAIITALILLTGCQNKSNETFEKKKMCSEYIEKASTRIEEATYYGTYHSKKLETCISKYFTDTLFDQTGEWHYYHDELTGTRPQDLTVTDPNFYEWYDGVGVLIKDKNDYQDYEIFLELAK